MAVYDLEEQEQLDELKTWWKQYGNLLTGAVVAVSVVLVGWQGWNWWQRDQGIQAAAVFAAVERAAGEHDAKKAREATGELIDKFSRTPYAAMAVLVSARLQVEAGDTKTAKLQLGWTVDNARDGEIRDLARLRLATVLFAENAYEEALKQLASDPVAPFSARYAEVRGDILAAQEKHGEAKAAYQQALSNLVETQKSPGADQSRGQYHDLLQLKVETIGSNKP